MGQSLGLTDLQRKMESQQATLAELLKVPRLRDSVLSAPSCSADAAGPRAAAAADQPCTEGGHCTPNPPAWHTLPPL